MSAAADEGSPWATPGSDVDRLARVGLGGLSEPGDLRITRLVAEMGADRLYRALREEQQESDGLLADVMPRLDDCDPARTLDQASRQGIRFVVPGDAEWPESLGALEHAEHVEGQGGVPLGLWVRGPLRLGEIGGAVAVVGSRSATTYGLEVAGDIGAGIARAGRCLISGGAIGIDQAAHRGALGVGGPSVAVLACGVDRPYPAKNHDLLRYLGEHGALVSELAPGLPPMKMRFLSRNRVIAALAVGTVVVEAATRSGALNTANWTSRLYRPLLAVPGPVTSAQSEGVNLQIRNGRAVLVTGPAQVLESVAASGEHLWEDPRGPERRSDKLSARDRQVLDAVPVTVGARADSVARVAGLGVTDTRSGLARLEAAGLVDLEDGRWRLAHGDG